MLAILSRLAIDSGIDSRVDTCLMAVPDAESKSFRAGQAASLTGVSTDTLRHYERIGLLPKVGRTRSGYRQYSAGAIQRVNLIRRSLAIGFSLDDLSRILRVREAGGARCRQVRTLLADKLVEMEMRIEGMKSAHAHLQNVLLEWDQKLKATPAGSRAHLLDSFLQGPPSPRINRGLKQ